MAIATRYSVVVRVDERLLILPRTLPKPPPRLANEDSRIMMLVFTDLIESLTDASEPCNDDRRLPSEPDRVAIEFPSEVKSLDRLEESELMELCRGVRSTCPTPKLAVEETPEVSAAVMV
jgi:hypothetical protein